MQTNSWIGHIFPSASHMAGRRVATAAISKLLKRGVKAGNNVQKLVRAGPTNELQTWSTQPVPRVSAASRNSRNSLATAAQKRTKAYQNEVSRLRRSGEWRRPGSF